MLDQIINLVKQAGQETVVDNPQVPNEYNNEILGDATKTIASGFQNILAGGGLQNILDLFKGGTSSNASGGGIGNLLKNPIVTMMIGYFINKLMSKYKMNSSSANSLASSLIPNVLSNLISKTTDTAPENNAFDFNHLIGSLTGGKVATSETGGGFNFQGLLNQFVGGNGGENSGSGFDLQDIISQVTQGTQQNQEQQAGGGGLMDMIKGFLSK